MVSIRPEYPDVVLPMRLDDSLCILNGVEGEFSFAGVGMEDVKLHALGPSLLLKVLSEGPEGAVRPAEVHVRRRSGGKGQGAPSRQGLQISKIYRKHCVSKHFPRARR